jgi:hypothetical protein
MAKTSDIDDIVKVPLGDDTHYARVLSGASYAFYDSRTTEELSADEIASMPILFFAAVMKSTNRRWAKIGHISVGSALVPPPTFIQDALKKESFSLYWSSGDITTTTKEECLDLERAAVWEPEHIEDRLRDHYAGRPNKWLESMRIR